MEHFFVSADTEMRLTPKCCELAMVGLIPARAGKRRAAWGDSSSSQPAATCSSNGEWMHLGSCLVPATLLTGIAMLAMPSPLFSQQANSPQAVVAVIELTDAPKPQFALPIADDPSQDAPAQLAPAQQTPASTPTAKGSSSSQTPAQLPAAGKSQSDTSADQLREQEHQRVMGVMATFNTTRRKDALPLTPGQKFQLFFKSSTDPCPFMLAGSIAGIGQAADSYEEWGQGAQGYAKRFGAAYSDAFIGNFFGNAVLPVVMHEDHRYFQMGTGSPTKRVLWAAASTVWCRRDNGKWGPNYANVAGNLIGAAISNVYYPASEHTVSNTINDGLSVSAEGIIGAELIEFWPDIVRHHKRKKAEKLAQQTAQSDAEKPAAPAPQSAPAQPGSGTQGPR